MKVLFAISEAFPFIKVGGLGDVGYALPKALRKSGVDVRVILPDYSTINSSLRKKIKIIAEFNVQLSWRKQHCKLGYMEYEGVPFYFINNDYYFERKDTYGFKDDGERFAFFDAAVCEAINYMEDFIPDIVHCNDWQTGVIPVFLKEFHSWDRKFKNIKTVFTIHNLQYQGRYSYHELGDILGLSPWYFTNERLEFYGDISYMKGGINFSDAITTVSRTYADEITTQEYGEGLEDTLKSKKDKLSGIINGIDYEIFNPDTDKNIFYNYSCENLHEKIKNKLAIQKELGLKVNPDIPVIAMISRLADQKGLDIVKEVMDEIMELNIEFIVLGTAEKKYEEMFKEFQAKYAGTFSSNIFFNGSLAQKIYASADMFLMPSRFEPCGIGQMVAMRYGTVPLVRETGGLKDTVKNYDETSECGTGFTFKDYDSHEMLNMVKRAVKIYHKKGKWKKIMKSDMFEKNDWEKSAHEYMQLYDKVCITH